MVNLYLEKPWHYIPNINFENIFFIFKFDDNKRFQKDPLYSHIYLDKTNSTLNSNNNNMHMPLPQIHLQSVRMKATRFSGLKAFVTTMQFSFKPNKQLLTGTSLNKFHLDSGTLLTLFDISMGI